MALMIACAAPSSALLHFLSKTSDEIDVVAARAALHAAAVPFAELEMEHQGLIEKCSVFNKKQRAKALAKNKTE